MARSMAAHVTEGVTTSLSVVSFCLHLFSVFLCKCFMCWDVSSSSSSLSLCLSLALTLSQSHIYGSLKIPEISLP